MITYLSGPGSCEICCGTLGAFSERILVCIGQDEDLGMILSVKNVLPELTTSSSYSGTLGCRVQGNSLSVVLENRLTVFGN